MLSLALHAQAQASEASREHSTRVPAGTELLAVEKYAGLDGRFKGRGAACTGVLVELDRSKLGCYGETQTYTYRLVMHVTPEGGQRVRIGEAAERLGVSNRTIKYYEELGLLAPHRGGGNYRDYDDEDLERVERIRKLQKLGYSLAAIREFLKYPRQVDESGHRRLSTGDLKAALQVLEAQLVVARQHVVMAQAELEQRETVVAELEADVTRCRSRLARRQDAHDVVAVQ